MNPNDKIKYTVIPINWAIKNWFPTATTKITNNNAVVGLLIISGTSNNARTTTKAIWVNINGHSGPNKNGRNGMSPVAIHMTNSTDTTIKPNRTRDSLLG